MEVFNKQPNEVLDFAFEYSEWLANKPGVLPASFVVIADPGITVVSSLIQNARVSVVISGGVSGQKYKLTCRLTTNNGLVREAECRIAVREL